MKYTNPIYLYTRKLVKTVMKNRVYTARRGLAIGLKRRGGLDFLHTKPNREEAFLLGLELEGQTVVDIGGYEGIFTMYFAHKVGPNGKVYTFEPNPKSCETIEENVRINGFTNVDVRTAAVGSEAGEADLVFSELDPAQGSLSETVQANIEQRISVQSIKTKVVALDDEIESGSIDVPNLIKIDTEGFEYEALQGMKKVIAEHHPALYIENHGATWDERLDNTLRLTEFLTENGYHCYFVESEQWITEPERRNSLHLYCVMPSESH